MPKTPDIKDFAYRVEQLCDFLIAGVRAESGRNGSDDLRILERLKEDAADIQSNYVEGTSRALEGLYDHMRGLNVPIDEEK